MLSGEYFLILKLLKKDENVIKRSGVTNKLYLRIRINPLFCLNAKVKGHIIIKLDWQRLTKITQTEISTKRHGYHFLFGFISAVMVLFGINRQIFKNNS